MSMADTPPDIGKAQRSFLPQGNPAWLGLRAEEIIDPALPLIDPHHHLWGPPRQPYLGPEFGADLRSGHNFVATIFTDCTEQYRTDGPEAYRTVGETEFAVRVGEASDRGEYGPVRMCQGIISRVDLAEGAASAHILRAHIAAGRGRFKGIRFSTAWDPHPEIRTTARNPGEGLLRDPRVREGIACLAPLGLVLDTWVYHHQIPEVTAVARAFPGLPIVLNHVGGPVRIGPYAAKLDEVYASWRANIAELAREPNVHVKLGGLGMRISGFYFEDNPMPPSSEDLAVAWRPFIEPCITLFGAHRAMFESNFPVDSLSCSFQIMWNAFKRLAAGGSADERRALLAGTAARVYGLDVPQLTGP